ncbi:MAG: formate dehydrogenase accessory sulfurtransferase FdhD [Thermomicrobiales bacterium]|nr:formate dehydrogenase accessory sulfurtransferase FdhD [Thermomicrobiales bacterium]
MDDETGPVARPAQPEAFNLHPAVDALPEEFPVTIEINAHPVAKLLCTPSELQELGAGWVFGQGYAGRADEVRSCTVRGDRVSVMIDAPGPGGTAWRMLLASGFDARQLCAPYLNQAGLTPLAEHGDTSGWTMPRDVFVTVVGEVFATFRDERGAAGHHFAGATDGHQMSPTIRDVSRHNAVDKVVGWTLLRRMPRDRQVLCLSGRVSADIVLKAWRAGFPAIATRSLPTAEAVELAQVAGIALVGRVLDGRRAVFTHPWRFRVTG